MIWSEVETLPREEIEKIQLERLKKQVKYAYENVDFYKELFDEHGVHPDDIKELKDIQKFPFTTKEDILERYPTGMLAVEPKEVVRYHGTSGTKTNPVIGAYTNKDMETWKECIARIVSMAGVEKGDIAHIAFGYGLFTGGFGLHQGLEKVGAAIVPMSSGNSARSIKLMKDLGASVLIATPSYALRLGEVALEQGIDPKEDLGIRVGCFGGEGCTVAMREKISDLFGMDATENYGLCELMGPGISGECLEFNGLHINEDEFLVEIVDPETGEVLPEGETGELVITPLSREAMPIIRYKTHDISSLDYAPCACGRTSARMAKVTGRTDDMLIISGVNVFPSQIEEVLFGIEEIGGNYVIKVTKKGALDKISVDVELKDDSLLDNIDDIKALQTKIQDKFLASLGIHVPVNFVEANSIERLTGKAKRIIDLR